MAAGLGGILSAFGSIIGAIGQAQAANYQAQIAEMNAQIARDNAKRALDKAALDAQDTDTKSAQVIGELEADQGASGLSMTSRSPTLTRKTAYELGRKDTLNVYHAGEMDAYNHKVTAANQTAQANLYRMQASNSLLSGFIGGFSSLVGSAKPSNFSMIS